MAQDTKLTNLWDLLQKYEVVIPNFQRDYAQGREGKSDLRKRFLEQIESNLKKNPPLCMEQRMRTNKLNHWTASSV